MGWGGLFTKLLERGGGGGLRHFAVCSYVIVLSAYSCELLGNV